MIVLGLLFNQTEILSAVTPYIIRVKKSKIPELQNSEVIIWTTTPWTIPANKALAYNENLKYVIIKIEDETDFKGTKIVVAEDLLKRILENCKIKKFKKVSTFSGKDFKGTICRHPFFEIGFDYDIPMLEAKFVTI